MVFGATYRGSNPCSRAKAELDETTDFESKRQLERISSLGWDLVVSSAALFKSGAAITGS